MNKLALTLPGSSPIATPLGLKSDFVDLASLLSPLLNIAFYVAVFTAFFFLVLGAFAYITAQGKKEELAKARDRITWAIVGLIIVLLAYFIARYAAEILKPSGGLPF